MAELNDYLASPETQAQFLLLYYCIFSTVVSPGSLDLLNGLCFACMSLFVLAYIFRFKKEEKIIITAVLFGASVQCGILVVFFDLSRESLATRLAIVLEDWITDYKNSFYPDPRCFDP